MHAGFEVSGPHRATPPASSITRGSAKTRFLGLVDDVVQHASAGAAGVQRCAATHPDALRTADGGAQRLIASVMLAATVRLRHSGSWALLALTTECYSSTRLARPRPPPRPRPHQSVCVFTKSV